MPSFPVYGKKQLVVLKEKADKQQPLTLMEKDFLADSEIDIENKKETEPTAALIMREIHDKECSESQEKMKYYSHIRLVQ